MNIKICGLRDVANIKAATNAGARYIGLVFFEKSPRNVSLEQAAELALSVPEGVAKVALTVNATNAFFDELVRMVPLDMLQLHGAETPERVTEVKQRYGLPVMKAVGVADAADLDAISEYEAVADQILVETKAPKNADRPGGNGQTFDWSLIAGRQWKKPWMLAGGLTIENVADAISQTGATQVDLSSGVESSPGVKDAGLIKAFIEAAG